MQNQDKADFIQKRKYLLPWLLIIFFFTTLFGLETLPWRAKLGKAEIVVEAPLWNPPHSYKLGTVTLPLSDPKIDLDRLAGHFSAQIIMLLALLLIVFHSKSLKTETHEYYAEDETEEDVIATPKETVAAIITRGEGEKIEILLTRRNIEPFKGWWCLPGGHVDPDENGVEAVIREVGEETGMVFSPVFFGCFDEDIPSLNHQAHVSVFSGAASGEPAIDPGEVQASQWFVPSEALALDLAFIHREVLEAFLAFVPPFGGKQDGGLHLQKNHQVPEGEG